MASREFLELMKMLYEISQKLDKKLPEMAGEPSEGDEVTNVPPGTPTDGSGALDPEEIK